MKEEIEKILDDYGTPHPQSAGEELQILFLSKQIELLDEILAANHVAADALPNIHNWKAKLKSELQALQ